jgi:hypothetical protein
MAFREIGLFCRDSGHLYEDRDGVVETHTTLSAHPFAAELPPGNIGSLPSAARVFFRRGGRDTGGAARSRSGFAAGSMADRGWYSGDTRVHRTLADLLMSPWRRT